MDPVTLASAAVALVAPYLAEGGKELAKKVGGEAGERIVNLYDKVKAKLTGGGAEALADLEKQPEDADSQAVLRVQLKKALEADPAFRAELVTLIEEIKAKGGDQIIQRINVTGDRTLPRSPAERGSSVPRCTPRWRSAAIAARLNGLTAASTVPAPAHSPIRCRVMRRSRPRARCSNRKMPCQRPRSGWPATTGIDRCVVVSAARMCAGMSSEPSCVWV